MNCIRTLPVTLISLIFFSVQPLNAETVTWGALATSGTGLCASNCSNISTAQQQGGGQNATASTQIVDSKGVSKADVTLSTTDDLPTLKASAAANAGPNYVRSTATGVQSYTNTAGDRTINLLLDLHITTLEGEAKANAQVAVFLTNSLSQFSSDFGTTAFEIGYSSLLTSTELLNSPGFSNMTPSNTMLSFFVGAGQSFLIWAGLQTTADTGGTADAFSTFTMHLEDSSNLVAAGIPGAAVIPLPAGVWLFMSGIALLAGVSRCGRKRSATPADC